MTMGKKAIETLNQWGAFNDESRQLVVEGDRCSISFDVEAADRMSCAFARLRLEPQQAAQLSAEQLKAWADRTAKRVRYLLEAIETVELDATQGRLLLRSTPPEKRTDGDVLYYQLLLESSGRLSLDRLRYRPSDRSRSPERLRCTHEVLERLVDDLASTRG